MKDKIVKIVSIIALCAAFSMTTVEVQAQCPMCRMSAESNLKNGGSQGRGLNAGILYMLATPYFLVGGLAFVWWRGHKAKQKEDELAFSEMLEEQDITLPNENS